MTKDTERQHLSNIAQRSLYGIGLNKETIKYSFRIFSRYMRGTTVLELGPAEGIMTDLLIDLGKRVTVVEGAELFCLELKQRHPEIEVIHALFEECELSAHYDNILLGHVLEHVQDPVQILRRAATWLNPGGRILAAVPNSHSLHRQAAVILKLLPNEEFLNEMDRHHGHRRVFNPETFRHVFQEADLQIEVFGGYWLKPFANYQLEQLCDEKILEAFMQLGERYHDIAGEIYIVARR
jgi:2-polyprenyl-3-methyl-5-hydroxy-6-metoxy-1,4-benzoquinol methylase